jgi:hypothetical protein
MRVTCERSTTKSTLFMLSRITTNSLPSCLSDRMTNSGRCRDTSACPTIIRFGTSRGLAGGDGAASSFLRNPRKPSSASPETLSEPRRPVRSALPTPAARTSDGTVVSLSSLSTATSSSTSGPLRATGSGFGSSGGSGGGGIARTGRTSATGGGFSFSAPLLVPCSRRKRSFIESLVVVSPSQLPLPDKLLAEMVRRSGFLESPRLARILMSTAGLEAFIAKAPAVEQTQAEKEKKKKTPCFRDVQLPQINTCSTAGIWSKGRQT